MAANAPVTDQSEARPSRPLRISAAPKVRQVYWCDFWLDASPPEMTKKRPVVIVSYKNVLQGHCLVLPMSTNEQTGDSAKWAHKLSIKPDGVRHSWVICNHLYTVSTTRLEQIGGRVPRLGTEEFNAILGRMFDWLPTASDT